MLGKKVLNQQTDQSDFKKRLKAEIKDYLELRDGIRKHKVKDKKGSHAKSEKKIVPGIKLEKLNDGKNDEHRERERSK